MSRTLRALALVLLVAACGGQREYSAPRELDNACQILAERPQYQRAFRATERRWGVPVAVQMAIIYQESKFIGNARPPHEYALGIIPFPNLYVTWFEHNKPATMTNNWNGTKEKTTVYHLSNTNLSNLI